MCIRDRLTFLPLEQIDEMSTWKDQRLNEAKEILAYELTSMVHGKEEAEKAQNAARALFSGSAMDTEPVSYTHLCCTGKNIAADRRDRRKACGHSAGGKLMDYQEQYLSLIHISRKRECV